MMQTELLGTGRANNSELQALRVDVSNTSTKRHPRSALADTDERRGSIGAQTRQGLRHLELESIAVVLRH